MATPGLPPEPHADAVHLTHFGPLVLAVSAVGLGVAELVLLLVEPRHATRPLVDVVSLVAFVVLGLTGAIVLTRQPGNRVGRLLLGAALFSLVELTGLDVFASLALSDPALPMGAAALALDQGNFAPAFYLIVTVFLLIFPTGRATSPFAGLIAAGGAAGAMVVWLGPAFDPAALDPYGMRNPLAFGGAAVTDAMFVTGVPLLFGSFIAATVSSVRRWMRATGRERRQLSLVLGAAVVLVLELLICIVGAVAGVVALEQWAPVGVLLLVAAIAVSVLRYQLWDLDLLINRALVYVGLTAVVVAGYVALVVGFGLAVGGRVPLGVSLVATAVVAIAVLPLRQVLQRAVDRLMYGSRWQPRTVLAGVGRRLAAANSDTVLRDLTMEVGEALRLGGLTLRESDSQSSLEVMVATYGNSEGQRILLPLLLQGDRVGSLAATSRRDERLGARERRLLEDLTPQFAVAVHSVRLTRELRASRERLVAALEEERRRIRRDLHDGLGPTLTAVTLQTDAARTLLARDPKGADAMMAEVRSDISAAILEVRRLVYDLRPPALDELGLVGALRQQAAHFAEARGREQGSVRPLDVIVDAPEPLPELPAAVEVAAFRIVAEAVTNAARHADARTCRVGLTADGALQLAVEDDGRGIDPGAPGGIGLRSMRERASELGGSVTVSSATPHGTRVAASLPLQLPAVAP